MISPVLYDKMMPTKVKETPTKQSDQLCWATTGEHSHKMSVSQMHILKWMCDKTHEGIIWDYSYRDLDQIVHWYGHVLRRSPIMLTSVQMCRLVLGRRQSCRPLTLRTWIKAMWENFLAREITNDFQEDHVACRIRIHDPDNIGKKL